MEKCYCGLLLRVCTSWTDQNPDRRFRSRENYLVCKVLDGFIIYVCLECCLKNSWVYPCRMGLVVAILGGLVPPLCERCNDIILGLLRRLACLDEECKVARKSMETLVCADIFLANSSLEDLCLNEAVEEVFVFWGLTEFGTEVGLFWVQELVSKVALERYCI